MRPNEKQFRNKKNGIALCPNLLRYFECGLVSFYDAHTILVSHHGPSKGNFYDNLKGLVGKKTSLPNKKNHFREDAAIGWHRRMFQKI